MTDLKGLFDGLADQAKFYGYDAMMLARARRRGRRRRLARRVAPVVAGLVVLGVVTTAAMPDATGLGRSGELARVYQLYLPPFDRPTSLGWLPTDVTVDDHAPPLPAAAVGPAVGWYRIGDPDTDFPIGDRPPSRGPDQPTGIVLVTVTGRQYSFLPPVVAYSNAPAGYGDAPLEALSPDGRWLVEVAGGNAVARDLETTRELPLARADGGWAWSPDGRLLSIERTPDNTPNATVSGVTIDLSTGHSTSWNIPDVGPLTLSAVRDTGALVLVAGGASRDLRVIVDDPTSVQPRNDNTFRLSGMVDPIYVPTGGATILLRTSADNGRVPGDIVALDLATGTLSHVCQLPMPVLSMPRTGPTVPVPSPTATPSLLLAVNHSDYREIITTLPQGILLAHHWFASNQFHTSLELVDTTNQQLTSVTRINGTVPQIHIIAGPPR
jgi:hypothetical protein